MQFEYRLVRHSCGPYLPVGMKQVTLCRVFTDADVKLSFAPYVPWSLSIDEKCLEDIKIELDAMRLALEKPIIETDVVLGR